MTTTTLRIFDSPKTADRYTIIPPRSAYRIHMDDRGLWTCLAASADPFHPQGIGQHCLARPGPHLGKRITWEQLPAPVQRFARLAFPEFFLND